jgi:hypothetical protein
MDDRESVLAEIRYFSKLANALCFLVFYSLLWESLVIP